MYTRNIIPLVQEALVDTPVALLNGARQTGKSTLARQVCAQRGGMYLTLDDRAVQASALSDPDGFVRGLGAMTVIDEIQLAPDLFRAIKAAVDRDRRPGRFLLTGSADVLLLPNMSDSLAGRMEIITLHPLAQDEMLNRKSTFIENVFGSDLHQLPPTGNSTKEDLAQRIVCGGFPEALARKESRRRTAWFRGYETTILQRDIRDLANIAGLTELPRMISLLAGRSSGLMNLADIGRSLGLPYTTITRYMTLLQTAFLVDPVPAWSHNRTSRLVKATKVHLNDPGFTTWLCGLRTAEEVLASPLFGPLLESFVVAELRRMATWSGLSLSLYHFRNSSGREVDIVLEDPKGRVVGIEVKSATAIGTSDLAGLKQLRSLAGKKWVRGMILHPFHGLTPFDKDVHGVPLSALWTW
ncbi:MAG: ATP-binding protein [Bacteroidetes bacterium]|nr:ATP-binding protein [Bacteroidota bacterium]